MTRRAATGRISSGTWRCAWCLGRRSWQQRARTPRRESYKLHLVQTPCGSCTRPSRTCAASGSGTWSGRRRRACRPGSSPSRSTPRHSPTAGARASGPQPGRRTAAGLAGPTCCWRQSSRHWRTGCSTAPPVLTLTLSATPSAASSTWPACPAGRCRRATRASWRRPAPCTAAPASASRAAPWSCRSQTSAAPATLRRGCSAGGSLAAALPQGSACGASSLRPAIPGPSRAGSRASSPLWTARAAARTWTLAVKQRTLGRGSA
mmetsp:Transcript_20017/g.56526  ORF Transcript_20017/g.56526 Transcript_20017/m.56526 type:complete len:263 (-) Transcript_20017:707-1495(-)